MSDRPVIAPLNCCKCGNVTSKHTCALCGHRLCEGCSVREAVSKIRAARPRTTELSERELSIVRALAAGERPSDIAARLQLSIKTVSTYRSRALEKLGIQRGTTVSLANLARERGLLKELAA